jgi:type IV pilus assembly protein PilB
MNKIEKSVLDLIPSDFALENKVLPLSLHNSNLKIAMINISDFSLLKDLMFITRKNVIPVKMEENDLLRAIAENYRIPLVKKGEREKVKEFKVVQKSYEQAKETDVLKDDLSVIQNVNKYITEAINQGASDIHFEPFEKLFRLRYRIDGRLVEITKIPMGKKSAYISRVKIMAELDIAEKRRPQDGRIRMVGGNKIVDIRVSTMPTDFGEKIVLRLLDKSAFNLSMDNIGFSARMKDQFEHILKSPHGIILVTGPTGSGKTTTLYTALNYLNNPDVNILTIEDPIEYNLEGINQTHVRVDIGFTFAKALRSFLRQDPDIIMVGEIRDSETAEIAIRAALTGHLVLSTLHTNDASTAVTRLIEMGTEPFLVSSSLRMVIAQRLVRKICTYCKEAFTPDESLVRQLSTEERDQVKKYYSGRGCDYCNKTGYSGRTAIIELLPVSEKIADLILNHANASKINKHAQVEGMLTLRQHAILKIKEGITTLQEVIRETMV